MAKTQTKQLVVCVGNEGYAASLERRKIYVALRDAAAEKRGLLRVIDESGEDYLYPKDFFARLHCRKPSRRPSSRRPRLGGGLSILNLPDAGRNGCTSLREMHLTCFAAICGRPRIERIRPAATRAWHGLQRASTAALH